MLEENSDKKPQPANPSKVPMEQNNISLTRLFYDCFNKHQVKEALPHISDRLELLDMTTGSVLKGKEGYTRWNQNWINAFPDARIEITNLLPSGDMVIAEVVGHGTHKGELITPKGVLPPTGKTVELFLCDIYQFRNNELVRSRTYFDSASLLSQLIEDRLKEAA